MIGPKRDSSKGYRFVNSKCGEKYSVDVRLYLLEIGAAEHSLSRDNALRADNMPDIHYKELMLWKKRSSFTAAGSTPPPDLAIAKAEGYEPHAISFAYGQRHRHELAVARAMPATSGG